MSEDQKEMRRRARLIESLDRMVASGRVTGDEAARLRAAEGDAQAFDVVAREIRVRHATPKLIAAVDGGTMTQAEADSALDQLRAGEHSRSLRARLHGVFRSFPSLRRTDRQRRRWLGDELHGLVLNSVSPLVAVKVVRLH